MKRESLQCVLKRTAAGMLTAAMVSGCLPAAVYAADGEDAIQQAKQQIISMVGNAEMKELGESIEEGAAPQADSETVPEGTGKTYYVDADNGSDSGNGTTEETAWKSIEKVNSITFEPGDRILFKAGCEWENVTLSPKGSGEKDNPIIIGSYGEGSMPKISGNGKVGDAVLLMNQEYWDISNLDISNTVEGLESLDFIDMTDENGNLLGDYRGLRIAGKDAGQLDGYDIHDLYVHDVTGEDLWISGSGEVGPGIQKGNGWDKSKRTGGIVFEICQPDTDEPTTFNDITIENNVILNNSFGGIVVKQWNGDKTGTNELWASRDAGKSSGAPSYECDNWKPHTNVTIQDNYLSQKNSDYACNTIYLTSTRGAVVQRNISREAGTCGIEMYYTDDTTVQYNEVYDTRVKAGGADSNAIDPDKQSTNALIQYNYIHDTGDGILLCGFVYGSAVVRYNVIQDAEKRYLNPHGDKGVNYVYNNIFYNSREVSHVPFIESSGGSSYLGKSGNMHYFYNNVFYNAAESTKTVGIGEGTATAYDSNCYYGTAVEAPAQDANAVTQDPCFAGDLAGAKEEISGLAAIQLKAESPLIGQGKVIVQDEDLTVDMVSGSDLFGSEISGRTDIGAAQYPVAEGKGILSGYVTDPYGYRMEGAKVALDKETVVTTDENGYYSFGEIDADDHILSVTMDGYDPGQEVSVKLGSQSVLRKDLELGESHSTTGVITGTVQNAKGGIEGATVTVSLDGQSYQAVTEADGTYQISDIPVAQGYTVTAEKSGYLSAAQEGISVRPGASVTVDLILTVDVSSTKYLLNVDFDDYETGKFSGNDEWAVVDPGSDRGVIEIVEEENGNKYLHMNKTASGTISFYNKNEVAAEGIVTIEARVKRTDNGSNANQFGMYSYNKSDWKASDPAGSSNPMATFAFSKGNILSHNKPGASSTVNAAPYELDQWYIVRNVANLDTGTFDLYINDMDTPVLADQPLRTSKSEINRFLFFENGSNTGDICVDYFRVCVGEAFDYNDAELIDLKAEGIELEKTGDLSYEGKAPAGTESVMVTPVAGSAFAHVTVNGTIYNGTDAVQVDLKDGENLIPIVVTAEDGTTVREYTLKIEREDSAVLAYLTSLSVQGIQISPEFSSDVFEYTAEAGADIEVIRLEAVPVDGATIQIYVNGTAQADNTEITLQDGENVIEIEVGSQDGTNYATYKLTVTKEASQGGEEPEEPDDKPAQLADLQIEGISITPKFDPEVKEYTAKVSPETEKINLELTPADGMSFSIRVNGIDQSDNTEAVLTEGENIIEITVRSDADEENTAVYTLKVVKEKKEDSGSDTDITDPEQGNDSEKPSQDTGEDSQADKTEQIGQDNKAVQTGDASNAMIPLLLGAAAAVAGIGSVAFRKK